jgi:hypothetical protein
MGGHSGNKNVLFAIRSSVTTIKCQGAENIEANKTYKHSDCETKGPQEFGYNRQ